MRMSTYPKQAGAGYQTNSHMKFPIWFACMAVSGCIAVQNQLMTPLQMTYTSEPSGAMLYQGNTPVGRTPITLSYPGAEFPFSRHQCLKLQPVTLRWTSGAEETINSLFACPGLGKNQQFASFRPEGAPGLELDMQIAIQLQRNVILQQQADAEDTSAVAQFIKPQNAARPVPHQ